MCRSEPQTPARVSLTRIAPGSTSGTGYSLSSNSPPYARSTATRPFIRPPRFAAPGSSLGSWRLRKRGRRRRRAARGTVGPCGFERGLARGADADRGRGRHYGGRGLGLLVVRRDPFLELLHRLAERFRQLRELGTPEQNQHDEQDDHQFLHAHTEHVGYLLATILWPAGRRNERVQRGADRAVAELGCDPGGHRPLDLVEGFGAPLHDRAPDRVALDQSDGRLGGGRARPGLLEVRPGYLTEAGRLEEGAGRLGVVKAERHRVEGRRVGRKEGRDRLVGDSAEGVAGHGVPDVEEIAAPGLEHPERLSDAGALVREEHEPELGDDGIE